MIWTNYAWDLVFVCCIELELSIDSEKNEKKKFENSFEHCWNISMCNRDAVWYHQRNRFVCYKEINLMYHSHKRTEQEEFFLIFLKPCISIVLHFKSCSMLQIGCFCARLEYWLFLFLEHIQICNFSFMHVIVWNKWIYFHFLER